MRLFFAEYDYKLPVGSLTSKIFVPFFIENDQIIFDPKTLADQKFLGIIGNILSRIHPEYNKDDFDGYIYYDKISKKYLSEDIKKQLIKQSKMIYKTDLEINFDLDKLLYFVLQSKVNFDLEILLFKREIDSSYGIESKVIQLTANPDFSKKYVIIATNLEYPFYLKFSNFAILLEILQLYQKNPIDIDFIHIILNEKPSSSISGNKSIDEQIYLNMDYKELYRLSLTNRYVQNIINTKSFVEEYFDKHQLSRDIVLDKRDNVSYYHFWKEINDIWINRFLTSESLDMIRFTALQMLQYYRYQHLVKFILSQNKDLIDNNMLMTSIRTKSENLVKYILNNISDKNSIDIKEAYYSAISDADLNMVKIFVENGLLLQNSDINDVITYAETGDGVIGGSDIDPKPEIAQYLRTVYHV